MSEVRGLRELLDFRPSSSFETIAATLIGSSASPEFRTVTINKGKADGVRPDMAVITPAGVVGRIITPNARASQVQLLIDRNAAAGAMFVWVNSLAGVIARYNSGTFDVRFISPLIIAVVIGGFAGSYFGSTKFEHQSIQKIMGAIIIVAVILLMRKMI